MDVLVEIAKRPGLSRTWRALGLPFALPTPLRRESQPYGERVAQDAVLALWSHGTGPVADVLARCLPRSGFGILAAAELLAARFVDAGEAWARPIVTRCKPEGRERIDALVVDATGLCKISDLSSVYAFAHDWIRSLKPCGRVLVIADGPGAEPGQAAVSRALEGFTRSLAKEVGRRGVTANLLWLAGAEPELLVGPVRFLLSSRAAFISAQPLSLHSGVGNDAFQARPLAGKQALVTGAARGIGLATAQALAREGARLTLVDHPASAGPLSQVARALEGQTLLVDLARDEAPGQLCEHVAANGGVDIVVHNAGVTRDRTLARMSAEEWATVLDVNLKAVVATTDGLLATELLRASGRIVLLSSVGGIAGNPGQCNYAASKAGLIGYARAVALQLEQAGRGQTINAVAPGFIETRMTQAMPAMLQQAARRLSALNQGGLPGDVAEAVAFSASPAAGGMNGQVLRVCGGALIGA